MYWLRVGVSSYSPSAECDLSAKPIPISRDVTMILLEVVALTPIALERVNRELHESAARHSGEGVDRPELRPGRILARGRSLRSTHFQSLK